MLSASPFFTLVVTGNRARETRRCTLDGGDWPKVLLVCTIARAALLSVVQGGVVYRQKTEKRFCSRKPAGVSTYMEL